MPIFYQLHFNYDQALEDDLSFKIANTVDTKMNQALFKKKLMFDLVSNSSVKSNKES